VFIQVHTLRDYAVALPNRGQDGLAKRAPYGGVERQRISSQSIKAAMRDADDLVRTGADRKLVPDQLADLARQLGLETSVRSALIGDRLIHPELVRADLPEEEATAWTDALMGLWRKEGAQAADDTPLVVGRQECRALVEAALAIREAKLKPKEIRPLFEKATALRKAPEKVQKAIAALRAIKAHAGIDGAMFGRMATGVGVYNVDSAVHVAHALTVHPIQSVSDFFSVRDQLKDLDGDDRGGSHINTSELTCGLFYGYLVIDLRQLRENFAELSEAQRAELSAWIVRAFAQAEPAAKRGSTAPYAGLRECVVEIGRRQPRTLMGAFEVPVEAEGGRSLSDIARERLRTGFVEMDGLCGAPGWRSWLRDHIGGSVPAIERLAMVAGDQLCADK
jgi:CRISPR system Cascade subunit CasC